MDRSYWERIAPSYDEEIFDLLQNDKKALVRAELHKLASPDLTVMDAGCAIGKWLPVLSPAFKKVIAVDISAKNLSIAEKKYPLLKNVEYKRANFSGKLPALPACDVVICINALLTSSLPERKKFIAALSKVVKKNGTLILTVPSLESSMLTGIIGHQWKIDRALLDRKLKPAAALEKWKQLRQGNADIDNVPTKHFLREELELLFSQAGFRDLHFAKIEYDWTTEFRKPPVWLKEPRPWDWMMVAKKF